MLHHLQMGLLYCAIISVENKINATLLAAFTNMFWTKKTAYLTVALLHFWLTAVPLLAFTSPALHHCSRHYAQHSWLITKLFQYLYHGLQCSFCKKEMQQCPWCKINAFKPVLAYFPFSKRKLQMLHTIVHHEKRGEKTLVT